MNDCEMLAFVKERPHILKLLQDLWTVHYTGEVTMTLRFNYGTPCQMSIWQEACIPLDTFKENIDNTAVAIK